MGNAELPTKVIHALDRRPDLTGAPLVAALYQGMQATQARLGGDPASAVPKLERLVDGKEPVAIHAALQEAYAASGQTDKAIGESAWLAQHRGRAYSELGSGWCQQAMNVVDTTLARLRSAELYASLKRWDRVKSELQAFDRQWSIERLPDHLRLRRTALAPTSS
jgi:DNA polymerase III delta subunit